MENSIILNFIFGLLLSLNFANSEKYIFLILNSYGLANRLRVMASWYSIARLSERKLIVSWEPTIECNATFTNLFQKVPDNLIVLENSVTSKVNGISTAQAIIAIKSEALNNKLSFGVLKDREEEEEDGEDYQDYGMFAKGIFIKKFIVSKHLFLNGPDILLTDHNAIASLAGTPCQLYNNYKTIFYNKLIAIDSVNDMVNHVYKTYFEHKIMVGVHIRMHENGMDWAVVPPGRGGIGENSNDNKNNNEALYLGQGADPELFLDTMTSINNHFKETFGNYYNTDYHYSHKSNNNDNDNDSTNSKVLGDPDSPIRFYICSNNQTVKMTFLHYFPDAIVLDGPLYRNSTGDIQFALMEWLLLSHSSLLLHTYGSSFAEEAAAASKLNTGTPLVGLWRGINVLHKHSSSHHCGNNLYFEAYNHDQEDSVWYTENIKSKVRKVEGKLLSLRPCQDILSDWKIPNLYCFHS